jgi:hypothetical protein
MGNLFASFELAKHHDLITLIAIIAVFAVLWGGWKLFKDKLQDHTTMKGWIKAQRDAALATEQPKDPDEPRILVPRQRLLDEIKSLLDEIVSLKEQIKLYREHIRHACNDESCPVFVRMREYFVQHKEVEQTFLEKLLVLRRETQLLLNTGDERNKELYERLHQFMNETIARREAALEKKDDMIAGLLASQAKIALKNGGGH